METRDEKQEHAQVQEARPERPKGRLQRWLEALEERIAPACHYNPHGKEVGCGNYHYRY